MNKIEGEFKHWLQKDNALPERLTIDNEEYTILDRNEAGYVDIGDRIGTKGFVLKVESKEKKRTHALKINIPSAYQDKDPLEEVELSSTLGDHEKFIIPETMCKKKISELNSLEYFNNDDEFYCFISKWLDGRTLKSVINNDSDSLSPENIQEYLSEILDAVSTLFDKKLKHDDLHLGNVMLVKQGSVNIKEVVKIIDTGSLKRIDDNTTYGKRREDFYNFVSAIAHFRNALFKNRPSYLQHQQFVNNMDKLINRLNDDDSFRAFGDSIEDENIYRTIFKEIKELSVNVSNSRNLSSPFDALSAEHIPTNDILLKLFVHYDEFYTKLISNTSLLMHGPRGCGKTMAFRYASVNTQLLSLTANSSEDLSEDLKKIPYFGIYIGCSQLQPYLSWIENYYDSDKNYYQEGLVTFFSLYLAVELIETFYNVSLNQKAKEFYKIHNVNILTDFLFSKVTERHKIPTLSTSTPIPHLKNILEKIKADVYKSMLNKEKLPIVLGDAFILEVSHEAYKVLGKSRKITYLLDDYTFNRIPEKIQKSLNKIIWNRSHYQQFSISSEKNSYSTIDYQGANYDNNREYEKVDFGSMIVSKNNGEHVKNNKLFIINMMNSRFKALEWKGKVETLLGASRFSTHGSLSQYLKDHSKGTMTCYYGIDIISHLWSGDIALTLQLLSKVLKDVTQDQESLVLPQTQHDEIKKFSETYEKHIKNFYTHGQEMSNIAKSFGGYSHFALKDNGYMIRNLEYSLSTGEDIWCSLKETNKKAHEIARELIRKTIFIELMDGKAKEKDKADTVRWQLKKMYYPAHNISFGKNHYLDIRTIDEFVDFLTKPNKYLEQKRVIPNNQVEMDV